MCWGGSDHIPIVIFGLWLGSHLQGATVRVKIINSVTLAEEGYDGADGLLPYTINATTAPYVVQAATANRWNAIIRNAANQVGTWGSPIPHAGSWRFQIAVVSATWTDWPTSCRHGVK